MKLQEVRMTGLIDIGIYDVKADRAANIANMIGVVYVERRRADLQKNVDRGLEQLTEEVAKQREVMKKASAEAAQLRTEGNINDPNPDEQNVIITTDGFRAASQEKNLLELESRVSTLKLFQRIYPYHTLNRNSNILMP